MTRAELLSTLSTQARVLTTTAARVRRDGLGDDSAEGVAFESGYTMALDEMVKWLRSVVENEVVN